MTTTITELLRDVGVLTSIVVLIEIFRSHR
jgi:hypothetical protein